VERLEVYINIDEFIDNYIYILKYVYIYISKVI
jgi:hypothetical protein